MKRPVVERSVYWVSPNELVESLKIDDGNAPKYAHTYKRWDKAKGWQPIARWDNMLGKARAVLLRNPEKELERCKNLDEVLALVKQKSSYWGGTQ